MLNLQWDKAWEIGVDFIDEEHKNLLAIMRRIRQSILSGDYAECSSLSAELIRLAEQHFAHEERFLDKVGYPGLHGHKTYHQRLIVQALQVKEICESTQHADNLTACFDSMEQFLIDDIIAGDLQFVSFLEYEGHIRRRLA